MMGVMFGCCWVCSQRVWEAARLEKEDRAAESRRKFNFDEWEERYLNGEEDEDDKEEDEEIEEARESE